MKEQLDNINILKVRAEKKDALLWGAIHTYLCIHNLIMIFLGVSNPFLLGGRIFVAAASAYLSAEKAKKFIECRNIDKNYKDSLNFINKQESDDSDIGDVCCKIGETQDMKNNKKQSKENPNISIESFNEIIDDVLLKLILKTKEEIEQKRINETLKGMVTKQLSDLGIYYMNELRDYKNRINLLDFCDYKYKLRGECIRKLVDIEFYLLMCEQQGFDESKLESELEGFVIKMKNPCTD